MTGCMGSQPGHIRLQPGSHVVAGRAACQSSSSEGMQVGCRQKPATGIPCASPHMRATPVSVKALMIRSTLVAAVACSAVCTRGCNCVYQVGLGIYVVLQQAGGIALQLAGHDTIVLPG